MNLMAELSSGGHARGHVVKVARNIVDTRIYMQLGNGEALVYGVGLVDRLVMSHDVIVASDHVAAGTEPDATQLMSWGREIGRVLHTNASTALGLLHMVRQPNGMTVVYLDKDANAGITVVCAGLDPMRNQYFANLIAVEIQGAILKHIASIQAGEARTA